MLRNSRLKPANPFLPPLPAGLLAVGPLAVGAVVFEAPEA